MTALRVLLVIPCVIFLAGVVCGIAIVLLLPWIGSWANRHVERIERVRRDQERTAVQTWLRDLATGKSRLPREKAN